MLNRPEQKSIQVLQLRLGELRGCGGGGGQGSLLMFMLVNVEMVSRKAHLSMRCVSGGREMWPTRPLHWSGKSAISHVTSTPRVNPPPHPLHPMRHYPLSPLFHAALIFLHAPLTRRWVGGTPTAFHRSSQMERLNISLNATKAERSHTGPRTGGPGVLGQLLKPLLTRQELTTASCLLALT